MPTTELARLREQFVHELPARVGELIDALRALAAAPQAGPRAAAQKLAHALRGVAGSYGFAAVGEAARRIEEALAGPDTDAAELADALRAALRESEIEAGGGGADGPRLLVVGAAPGFLRLLGEVARGHLWQVVAMPGPEEAVESAKASLPDAAVIEVPAQGPAPAFQLAQRLRELARPAGLPLAFSSAAPTLAERIAAAHAGASLFLDQPLDAPALAMHLEALFAERVALREPISVLVVDGEGGFGAEAARLLEAAGVRVSDRAPATALLVSLDDARPDAVLLDADLPWSVGLDLCRALRTSPRWRDLPVILAAETSSPAARLEALQAGADDLLRKPLGGDELAGRVRALVLRARLLRQRADTDALTGLLLRRPFLDRVASQLAETRRRKAPFAVCLLDVDGFKAVNDRLGHLGADRILAAFGRLLASAFRLEDVRCRWGGDEFALAFPGQSPEAALLAVTRMQARARSLRTGGSEGLSLSAGIACFPADGSGVAELLREADQRLFRAKAQGGGCAVAA